MLVAIGVTEDGYRQVLGIFECVKEDKSGWENFLRHLKKRGLSGIKLVISDACLGLIESVNEFYPDAKWQRCIVHFYRNVFSVVPRTKVKHVARMLKAIHASEDGVAAKDKAAAVIKKLDAQKLYQASKKVKESIGETLAYYLPAPIGSVSGSITRLSGSYVRSEEEHGLWVLFPMVTPP